MKARFAAALLVVTASLSAAHAKGGFAATVQPLATEAALDALRRGGNAVDAAAAAALTLGVVDGHNSGIGGGCFILLRTPDGKTLIVATHRLALLEIVDRVIWLENGRVVADRPTAEVLAQLTGQNGKRAPREAA